MNKNGYSKFKYENNYKLKFSVNPFTQQPYILNTDLKVIKPNLGLNNLDTGSHLNIGQVIVVDNIYTCDQVNYVDQPVIKTNSVIKQVFFNFFKLR